MPPKYRHVTSSELLHHCSYRLLRREGNGSAATDSLADAVAVFLLRRRRGRGEREGWLGIRRRRNNSSYGQLLPTGRPAVLFLSSPNLPKQGRQPVEQSEARRRKGGAIFSLHGAGPSCHQMPPAPLGPPLCPLRQLDAFHRLPGRATASTAIRLHLPKIRATTQYAASFWLLTTDSLLEPGLSGRFHRTVYVPSNVTLLQTF